MSDVDEESPFDEKPSEFLASIGNTGGRHDGQAIVLDHEHLETVVELERVDRGQLARLLHR